MIYDKEAQENKYPFEIIDKDWLEGDDGDGEGGGGEDGVPKDGFTEPEGDMKKLQQWIAAGGEEEGGEEEGGEKGSSTGMINQGDNGEFKMVYDKKFKVTKAIRIKKNKTEF